MRTADRFGRDDFDEFSEDEIVPEDALEPTIVIEEEPPHPSVSPPGEPASAAVSVAPPETIAIPAAVEPDLSVDPAVPGPEQEPEQPPVRGRVVAIVGRIAIALGAFVVLFALFEFGLSGLLHSRAQRDRLRDFKNVVQSGVGTIPSWSPATGTPLGILRIPAIGLQEVVVQGTTPDLLKGGPGHLRTSSLPGHVGNVVIDGRRTSYGSPFGGIGDLVAGNTIEVVTPQGPFTYEVAGKRVVMPGQPDVTGPSTDNRLTLVTSSPAFTARGRLVVIAKLQGAPLPALDRTIAPLGSDESGLSGDVGAFGPIVVWLEFLAMAAVLGALIWRRRWNRRVAYLLGMPILIALLILVFENLDRLLPATL